MTLNRSFIDLIVTLSIKYFCRDAIDNSSAVKLSTGNKFPNSATISLELVTTLPP